MLRQPVAVGAVNERPGERDPGIGLELRCAAELVVDELEIHLIPVLLGAGRLLDRWLTPGGLTPSERAVVWFANGACAVLRIRPNAARASPELPGPPGLTSIAPWVRLVVCRTRETASRSFLPVGSA